MLASLMLLTALLTLTTGAHAADKPSLLGRLRGIFETGENGKSKIEGQFRLPLSAPDPRLRPAIFDFLFSFREAELAERGGFEPPVRVNPVRQFSKLLV